MGISIRSDDRSQPLAQPGGASRQQARRESKQERDGGKQQQRAEELTVGLRPPFPDPPQLFAQGQRPRPVEVGERQRRRRVLTRSGSQPVDHQPSVAEILEETDLDLVETRLERHPPTCRPLAASRRGLEDQLVVDAKVATVVEVGEEAVLSPLRDLPPAAPADAEDHQSRQVVADLRWVRKTRRSDPPAERLALPWCVQREILGRQAVPVGEKEAAASGQEQQKSEVEPVSQPCRPRLPLH